MVLLEVMWGWGGIKYKQAPRWYTINPENRSGKRLYSLLGHDDFVVTNSCKEYVAHSDDKGMPDPGWVRDNLAELKPKTLVVCGKVAQETFKWDMVSKDCVIIFMPHPAARGWTKEGLEIAKRVFSEKRPATLGMRGEL